MKQLIHKTVQLKNGKQILIRRAEPTDAENLRETVRTYLDESDYIPKSSDEFKLSVAEERSWISSFAEKENSLLLVALYDDNIIGNIDITGSMRNAMQHTGVIGMGMLSEWRNLGLGTALMQVAIDWAQQNQLLELLWLEVYTDNTGGVTLYKNRGFEECGIVKDFFKHDDRYFDKLTMYRSVKMIQEKQS